MERTRAHAEQLERDQRMQFAAEIHPAQLAAAQQKFAADRAQQRRELLQAQAAETQREHEHHFHAERAAFQFANPEATPAQRDAHDAVLGRRYVHALSAPAVKDIVTAARAGVLARLKAAEAQAKAAASKNSAPTRITCADHFHQLPSGAEFIDPHGVHRRKP